MVKSLLSQAIVSRIYTRTGASMGYQQLWMPDARLKGLAEDDSADVKSEAAQATNQSSSHRFFLTSNYGWGMVCGSTIAGIELSSFPAHHGESVSRVTLGADPRCLRWRLCPTARHFSRALVAHAAQPIDVLSCEGLVRLDFVVLIS